MSVPVPATASAPRLRAYVLAFTTIYLVWGSTYLAIRVAVETMPPFAMAAIRFALAGALLFTFLRLRGTASPTPRQWRDAAVSGFFLLLGGNGLVTWGRAHRAFRHHRPCSSAPAPSSSCSWSGSGRVDGDRP